MPARTKAHEMHEKGGVCRTRKNKRLAAEKPFQPMDLEPRTIVNKPQAGNYSSPRIAPRPRQAPEPLGAGFARGPGGRTKAHEMHERRSLGFVGKARTNQKFQGGTNNNPNCY